MKMVIVRESESYYSSALVVVKKVDGSIRLTANFAELNDRIQDDHYSTPNPDDILSRAANARYISAIDQRNAYYQPEYQVELTERSKKCTAFRFLNYLLQFNRILAGLK